MSCVCVCVKSTFLFCGEDLMRFILQHNCCTLVCPFIMTSVSLHHPITVDKHWAEGDDCEHCCVWYVYHSGVQSYEQPLQ